MAKTRYHHGELRQGLVAAALRVVERGDDLTLRGVAREAGVSHMAPYHHFSDRRALLAAVAEAGLRRMDEAIEAARQPGADPIRQLIDVGVAYVRFALDNPTLFRLVFSAELADRSDLPELQAGYDASYRRLRALVEGRLGEGTDPEDVRFWTLRGWSMAHGLANLLLDEQVRGVRDADEAEKLARRVFLADLALGVRS